MASDVSLPLNYYAVFDTLQHMMPKDAIIVSEGANTMDIGRTILANYLPKHRSENFFVFLVFLKKIGVEELI